MTREKAIVHLIVIGEYYSTNHLDPDEEYETLTKDELDAICLAIKALEQQPSEDAISRRAVLDKIKEVCFSEEWVKFRIDNGSDGQRDFLINYIKKLPVVTPQPKMGKWIYTGDYLTEGMLKCSECGEEIDISKLYYDFCPNCGAKMQEVEENG